MLTQQKCIFSLFGILQVQDQRANRSSFSWSLSLWHSEEHLSLDIPSAHAPVLSLFSQDTLHLCRVSSLRAHCTCVESFLSGHTLLCGHTLFPHFNWLGSLKTPSQASNMAQQIKASTAKLKTSLILRTHTRGKNQLLQVVLWPPHVCEPPYK